MKVTEIYKNREILKGKIFLVTEGIRKLECDPDEGMFCRLVSIHHQKEDDDPPYYKMILNFGEFEEHNVNFMKAVYYDDDHIPRETWKEQFWYDEQKYKVEIYAGGSDDFFELKNEENTLFLEYVAKKTGISYIQWLENEVNTLRMRSD